MSLDVVSYRPTVYSRFEFDGTPESIDALNAFLVADGGGCEAQYVDATTWRLKNPGFNDNFYDRDISEVWVFGKTSTTPAVVAAAALTSTAANDLFE